MGAGPFADALRRYAAAVGAKDAAAFAALYADDVEIFDTWDVWSMRGLPAWRAMAEAWFASLGDERLVVEVADAREAASGDLAFGHAVLTFTAFSADGQRLRSLDNRLTMVLRKTGGAWKIVHEHTSVPVAHETLAARLRSD